MSYVEQIVDEHTPFALPPIKRLKPLHARYELVGKKKRVVVSTDKGRVLFVGTPQKTALMAYNDLRRVLNSQIVFKYDGEE